MTDLLMNLQQEQSVLVVTFGGDTDGADKVKESNVHNGRKRSVSSSC